MGRMDDHNSFNDGDSSTNAIRVEKAGYLGEISCVFDGDTLLSRTRPYTHEFIDMESPVGSLAATTFNVNSSCAWIKKCDSCPKRKKVASL